MSRTTGRRAWAACAIGAAAVLALTACTAEPPPPPALRVDRGSVQSTVSASGTLVGISEQTLGFPRRGQLTQVLVGVGDQVVPGQELARVDDFALRQTLSQEQASLAEAQAELDRATGNNRVNATGRTLGQAQEILDAVKKQVDETNDLNRAATNRAREQLDFDKKVLDRAWDVLRRDEEACEDEGDSPPSTTTTNPAPSRQSQQSQQDTEGSEDDEDTGSQVEGASFRVEGIAFNSVPAGACERLDADRTAVENAKRTVLQSEAALDTAKHQEDVDAAAGKVSIEREQQTVISAENDSGAAQNDRPADIEVRRAQLRNAQAAVRVAQQDVDNTVLYAPAAGTVSAINGKAGEFVGEASGLTPVAPGSTARIPQSNDISSGDNGGSAQSTGPLMVLNNLDTYQLVVPFEESDAARIAVNQQVEVTVDAIPDLRAPATVLSIAPTGTPSSGIVEYNATIVLRDGSDARLRDGQTALADVITESVDNVLRVPSAAVQRDVAGTFVDVRGEDGQPVRTPFEAGATGDEYTQVLSGLREGQELLLPPPPTPAATGGGPGG
ncbi:HlyD family efflux transporter periplasmic adaptor subunit [Pseudonocardia sp. DSM 110487]|uniref:HlyD family efflux transporter periplasmic adaptor subunit n=1 Tax=Pseudonocardia sp. DSM 110487 TaxID=2865833 RepID=UPI001C69F2AA|nr:HlyD family efflux transporter periplasmic adaptor subunit [Pseudonocardia sp. DSM 110487]QYN33285.1 HlyD family efflux transporter periplasmic adaptor subunit [Pseudonocardia sp. DSM 110487]